MLRNLFLTIHIVAGTAGLLSGPVAMLLPKRHGWHTRLGLAYQGFVAVLCVTAFGMVALKPSLWWLAVIAAFTWAAALTGWIMRRRRPKGWLPLHVSFMCGSYISFITAFLAVTVGGNVPWTVPLAWSLPTLIGSPLIARTAARAATRPRKVIPAAPPVSAA
jgi:hypothetical protein